YLAPLLVTLVPDNGRAVADFHTGFNLLLALIFFPLLKPFARLLQRLLPSRTEAADPGRPLFLDPAAIDTPVLALGLAAREVLRMADVLESMLVGVRDAFDHRDDRRQIDNTKRMDDVLDRLNGAIKGYVTALDNDALNDTDLRRIREVLAFCI